jgi:hypothetical protein
VGEPRALDLASGLCAKVAAATKKDSNARDIARCVCVLGCESQAQVLHAEALSCTRVRPALHPACSARPACPALCSIGLKTVIESASGGSAHAVATLISSKMLECASNKVRAALCVLWRWCCCQARLRRPRLFTPNAPTRPATLSCTLLLLLLLLLHTGQP